MRPDVPAASSCISIAGGSPGTGWPEPKPTEEPGRTPQPGPSGPRTPYPVDDPGIPEPGLPGSEPDVMPGRPLDPGIRF